jgi:transcriptional regulator with XRE-family HTH domain
MTDEAHEGGGDLHAALGKKIRDRRISSGLTQAELADRIAISRTSLTNMELGRQRLLVDQLYKMAEVLNTKPQDLLPAPVDIVSASARSKAPEAIPESVHRFAEKVRTRKHK